MPFKYTEKQLEALDVLVKPGRYYLGYGGSRSGKTTFFTRNIILRAGRESHSRHLVLRHRFNHLKASILAETFPKVLREQFPHLPSYDRGMDKTDWYYELPNNSQIWFGGLDDKDRTEKILGSEYATIYLNEASQMAYDAFNITRTRLAQKTRLQNKFFIDCNPPPKSHWLYKLFLQHLEPKSKEPLDPERYRSFFMNPADNIQNLDPDYLQTLRELPKRQRDRFLHGLFVSDIEGALWRHDWIETNRVYSSKGDTLPVLVRVIVAVDPAVTGGEDADSTGIIVAGIDEIGEIYILGDYTMKGTPKEWVDEVCRVATKHDANYIVAETNQGGDLVKELIEASAKGIPVKTVHAKKGKLLRAEPASALYERNRVHHDGEFHELEEQMITYIGDPSQKSPDNLDALVYAVLELAGMNQEGEVRIRGL